MPKRTDISFIVIANEVKQSRAVWDSSGLPRRLSAPRNDELTLPRRFSMAEQYAISTHRHRYK